MCEVVLICVEERLNAACVSIEAYECAYDAVV